MPDSSPVAATTSASAKKPMTAKDKLVLLVVGVLIIAAVCFGVYWFFIKVQPKAVSIVSQYAEEITVEINGQSHTVRPYANYAAEVTTGDKLTLVAKNAAGDVLYEKEQAVGRGHGLWIAIISPEETKEENKKCIAQGNIADMFYKKQTSVALEGNIANIKDLKVLSDSAVEDYYISLGNFFSGFSKTWIFPGKMDYADLPDEIDEGDAITGTFYFECADKDDLAAVSEQAYGIVSFETNYDDYLTQWEEEGTL